jgi:hypothetical protein
MNNYVSVASCEAATTFGAATDKGVPVASHLGV